MKKHCLLYVLVPLLLISPQAAQALDPDSLLLNKHKMSDSVLFAAYKEIHRFYSAFAKDTAIYYDRLALEEAKNRGNGRYIVGTTLDLCSNFVDIGDYPSAQKYLTEALPKAEEIKDYKGISAIYNNIGIIFGANKDFQKAIEYYYLAIEANKKYDNWIGVGTNLINMTGVLIEYGQLEEAKTNLFEALEIFGTDDNRYLQSCGLNNLGEVYLSLNLYDSAQYYLQKSLHLKQELGIDKKHLAPTLNSIGDSYMKTMQYDSAYSSYKKSFSIADSLKLQFEGQFASKGLYHYYQEMGDYQNALKYFEIHTQLKDDFYNTEKNKQINELEIRYQVDKKNQEIEALNSEVLVQRRLRNLGILILILAVALFVLTYMRIRLRSQLLEKENELEKAKSVQLKYEVAEKNRELMSHSMLSIQKNQILNDLKDKLLTIKDGDKCIHQAIKLVEENHSADSEWENLKIHFEGVHPGFFTELQEACTELTSTDLRHCAYIKIQMSTKDVARIMNVDPKSVKMTRYRLKKKLSLSEEDSLENYLINL